MAQPRTWFRCSGADTRIVTGTKQAREAFGSTASLNTLWARSDFLQHLLEGLRPHLHRSRVGMAHANESEQPREDQEGQDPRHYRLETQVLRAEEQREADRHDGAAKEREPDG